MEKPFAPACERNKDPILKELQRTFDGKIVTILEIGSGTGQHAVHFAKHMKNITWITSDDKTNHDGIKAWIKEADLPNLEGPLSLKFGTDTLDDNLEFDVVFASNIIHIMSWKEAKTMMKQLGKATTIGTKAIFYGPFNQNGEFTSQGNEDLDAFIKSKNPKSGIRDYLDVVNNMVKNGFLLLEEIDMPANNKLLIFERN